MLLYFSGTGNSAYVAKRIEKETGDTVVNLFDKIKENDFSELYAERPWIIVVPTYAWRIPHIVEKWIENTEFTGNRDMYFVMTCGGSIGNAYFFHGQHEQRNRKCPLLPNVRACQEIFRHR